MHCSTVFIKLTLTYPFLSAVARVLTPVLIPRSKLLHYAGNKLTSLLIDIGVLLCY